MLDYNVCLICGENKKDGICLQEKWHYWKFNPNKGANMSVKFIATIGGVNGPVASTESEAVVRLREYMETHLGKRHFQDLNPADDYQNTLFKLYEKEEGKDGEASLSGASDTHIQSDVSVSNLH